MNRSEARTHLDDDRGLDLLHGLLDAGQETTLLAHLRECARCEERFRQLAGTHERGRARMAELLAAVPMGLVIGGRPASRPGPRWLPIGLGMAAAAAITLLVLHEAQVIHVQQSPRISSAWLPAAEADITLRADGAALDDSLRMGLEAYARHDLNRARAYLQRDRPRGTADDVRRIYLSDVLLRKGQPASAVRLLEPIQTHNLPEPWRSGARWTLFLALEAAGQTASADSLLRQLASEPGAAGERARARLGERRP